MPWQRRRTLCAPSWPETRTKGPERIQPPHDRGRKADGRSNFVSNSDEEKESGGRARVLQRRGRARVRELVIMAESIPVEAKRLSALETKSVTSQDPGGICGIRPRILRLERLLGEALEVDRLLTEFMHLLFLEATGFGKVRNCWQSVLFFFPTFA